MMSYPLEKDKGKAFGIFWAIFQFGSFIGAIIALAINLNQGHLDAVATSTYIVSSSFTDALEAPESELTELPRPFQSQAFLVIIFFGIASAFAVLPPHRVIRPDGTIVRVDDQSSIPKELKGLWERVKDWRILGVSRYALVHVGPSLSARAI